MHMGNVVKYGVRLFISFPLLFLVGCDKSDVIYPFDELISRDLVYGVKSIDGIERIDIYRGGDSSDFLSEKEMKIGSAVYSVVGDEVRMVINEIRKDYSMGNVRVVDDYNISVWHMVFVVDNGNNGYVRYIVGRGGGFLDVWGGSGSYYESMHLRRLFNDLGFQSIE